MIFVCLLMSFVFHVSEGSSCPNRTEIYPCICIDKQIGKTKFEDTIICQRMMRDMTSQFVLRSELFFMEMDKFLLYDSFWAEPYQRLPEDLRPNFITKVKATEIKVVDTSLTTFGCPSIYMIPCSHFHLKRFTAINTTVIENNNCSSIYSWISCSESIEFIEINGCYTNNLTLKPDFFPASLDNLKAFHMPYNSITRIDRRTFTERKFPELETLDLSHNLIRDIQHQFTSKLKVKNLDFSYNYIRNVIEFDNFPDLKLLNLSNNHILSLLQNNWINTPARLRTIDLTKNNIECNCAFNWVNKTFHISTNLNGHCTSPPEVANMKLRKASRLLAKRCKVNEGSNSASGRTTAPSTNQ